MLADVPVGAFLSGGIDSGIVVALMARQSSKPVKTFTIGFSDNGLYDETERARRVAAMYGTEHHEYPDGPARPAGCPARGAWHPG
jgi:asparagine synthase (glutamine-hydrolysing)